MRRSAGKPAAKTATPTPAARADRANKENLTGYFAPAVKVQLRYMSLEHSKTIQALLGEALNLLFEKYGKPAIANAGDE